LRPSSIKPGGWKTKTGSPTARLLHCTIVDSPSRVPRAQGFVIQSLMHFRQSHGQVFGFIIEAHPSVDASVKLEAIYAKHGTVWRLPPSRYARYCYSERHKSLHVPGRTLQTASFREVRRHSAIKALHHSITLWMISVRKYLRNAGSSTQVWHYLTDEWFPLIRQQMLRWSKHGEPTRSQNVRQRRRCLVHGWHSHHESALDVSDYNHLLFPVLPLWGQFRNVESNQFKASGSRIAYHLDVSLAQPPQPCRRTW
jgi:hypothetical protein